MLQIDNDPATGAIVDFNKKIQKDPRVDNVILTIRDGLMLIRKKNDAKNKTWNSQGN